MSFLNDNNIPHVTSGPLTTRGHVEIKCPFCGDDDPSMHCGINLTTSQWNCWRDATHKGASPYRLISALLGVSGGQAKHIVQAYSGANLDDFDAPQAPVTATQGIIKPVEWPDDFEPLKGRFLDYLLDRSIDNTVADYYALACCRVGRWKQRVIIPVFNAKSDLIGWQGRAIVDPLKAPRYLTSHEQVKRTVLNLQNISKGGETLYICEGPFDAMKLDYYGKPRVRATCVFGVSYTSEQVELLSRLSSKFQRTVLLLDKDSAGLIAAFSISDWLPNVTFGYLPDNIKDPGSMSKQQILNFLK